MWRRLTVLGLALAVMGLWGLAYRSLGTLRLPFFRPTPSGIRALVPYLQGDHAAAARAARDAQRAWPPPGYENDVWGIWAVAAGDLDGAVRRARTALTLVPSAVEPLVTLGEVELDRGSPGRAMPWFAAALSRAPITWTPCCSPPWRSPTRARRDAPSTR